MRGELVIVRDYRGRPFIRRIWDIGEDVIYITNDKMLQLLMDKDPQAIGPIGVPKDDVFQYDPIFAKSINKEDHDWGILKPVFK